LGAARALAEAEALRSRTAELDARHHAHTWGSQAAASHHSALAAGHSAHVANTTRLAAEAHAARSVNAASLYGRPL
jgi:hypothetical protein